MPLQAKWVPEWLSQAAGGASELGALTAAKALMEGGLLPTLSEAVKEAALAVDGRAIHI